MRAQPHRRGLTAALLAAVVVLGGQVAAAGPAHAKGGGRGAGPAPVSNAFAMGGGIGGQIDQRTGAFQASVPLLNISGRGGSDLAMSLSYDQNLAAQGAAGNRFGFGSGWALGMPWVNTIGTVRVYAGSGGSYLYDASSPTGLHEYPLRDLTFAKAPGTLAARTGVAQARSYTYTLTQHDGTVNYFDASGNLLEQADRFGNLIDLSWRQAGQSWQPTTVVDNYGDVTMFDYSTPGHVKVTAPANAEGIAASTDLAVQAGLLSTVTDASGALTSFRYVAVGALTSQLLHTITAPSGAHTTVNYTTLAFEPSVAVVANVQVTDGTGTTVQTQRTFDIDPSLINIGHHNYTGYPTYNKAGTDGLFDSNDHSYRYSTTLSDGRTSVTETYNSLHLLVTRTIRVADPKRGRTVQQTQTYSYPSVSTVLALPANYAKPTGVTVVYGDPVYGTTRTTTSSSSYDQWGELLSATDETGTQTSTTYDPTFGVPLTETTTGADGTTSVTTNTLTTDHTAVYTTSTAVGSTDQAPTARTVTTFSYDGAGELTGQSVTWTKNAKPSGPTGGPDQLDTSRAITVDTTARTRTVIDTQAAGTIDAAATTTVTDLITGNVLSTTDPDKLTTTYTHDALGRVTTKTAPGGRTTTTTYPTPLITDVTDPTGHTTETTTDVLGRTVKVTDNVISTPAGEAFAAKPTARTLTVNTYSVDGSTATSTPATGATTTTAYDPLQRPLTVVKPDGLTESIAYNDVAHTKTTAIIPKGTTTAAAVTVERFDNLARTLGTATSYADNTPQTPSSQTYDGLGRVSAATANDVTGTPSYTGTGGLQTAVALTPTNTGSFPGGTEAASTTNTMTGALSTKTLIDHASTGTTSTTGATLTYDAAGRVATAADPGGGTTSHTYTFSGKTKTVTAPSGTVTTYNYSPTTGQLLEKDLRGTNGTTQKTAYTYYPDSGLVETTYDPDHPTDVITYQYDLDGHTTAVQYPDGTSTQASYALNGQLASTTDITGAVTTYAYDATGTIVTGATQTRGSTQLAQVVYGYDSLDRVHTIDRGNGVTTTIDYSDANQITGETTTGSGTTLRADSYSYDAHGNTATHTTTVGSTTTTTRYGYDAYDRLLSSAVYPNAAGTGTVTSTTNYVLNAGGDVTGQTVTANGVTTTIVNTVTSGDRLTDQTVNGGTATPQTYTTDGAVERDLNGTSYQYDLADQPASVTTPNGGTTSYTYWPDGTRRSSTTTVDGVSNTTTLHYDTTGQPANDTYSDSTGDTAQTASYLLGVNRESRSLTDSSLLGSPPPPPGCLRKHHRHAKCPHPKPPCHKKKGCKTPAALSASAGTDASGTQYYLADAHGSMVGMSDASGALAATYHYGDYGQRLDGTSPAALATPAATAAGNAAVNPFTYNGTYTDPSTGTQILPARAYDPAQGRFLSLDSTDMLNRYQAFDTNPIDNTDPTGHGSVSQTVTDAVSTTLFAAFAILAAIPVIGELMAGAAAIAELSTAATVTFAANILTAATNTGAFVTSLALTVDDDHHIFSKTQREQWQTSTFALGTAAGGFGGVSGGAGIAAGLETDAALTATKTTLADTQTTLADTKTALAESSNGLILRQEALTNTRTALTNTQTELTNAQADLAGTRFRLTTAENGLEQTGTELAATKTALTNTQRAFNDMEGRYNAAVDSLATAEDQLALQRSAAATAQSTLPQTAKQVTALTAQLAAASDSTEQTIAHTDPNANFEPPPTQNHDTPIAQTRGSNLSFGGGWWGSGLGSHGW